MATNYDFIEYLMDQLNDLENVTFKKMFGEYMIYYLGKPILLVCDNNVFVKINETTTNLLTSECCQGYPYQGAKMHYLLNNVDDKEKLKNLVIALEKVTPLPKKKKKNVKV